ncbi:hypothetical protein [Aurantiacibacter poecillastricola]|uniref:hypothetical protein n=1 Tax=Aurantiacibacter poecillastricola TaxID=3064385 RepID=UPI00273D3F54|nr:hypothetical protein [Aurantiacibacter sp. 219JJ12-13]MDP5260734.1 hypothetical protein [Aurantiacibacter sp. 219JJ12-13]
MPLLRFGRELMAALGCFLLLALPLAGLMLGGWLAGPDGMIVGAGIGFAIALVVTAISGRALLQARRR